MSTPSNPNSGWSEFGPVRGRRRGGKRPPGPVVSIQIRGTIALSPDAYALLGEPASVILLYDCEGRRVGLRAADPDDRRGYRVRPVVNGQGYHVSGRAFLRRYAIPHETLQQLPAQLTDGGILAMQLPELDSHA